MRRLFIGCGTILITVLVIGLLCSAVYWIVINRVDRQDHQDVGWAFANALRDNDIDKAKSLATRSQWKRIDSWVESHKTFHCPFPFSLDLDEYPTGGGGGIVPSDEDTITSIAYYYKCGSEPYNFSINEIVLERTSEGWIVTDWSYIDESFDW